MGLLDNLNFSQPFSLSSLLPSEAQLQAYKDKSDAEAIAQYSQDPNPIRRGAFNLLTALGVNPTLAKAAPTTADVLPVTGDISALADAKTAFGKGDYLTGGLLSMAALPFVPSIVGKGKALTKQQIDPIGYGNKGLQTEPLSELDIGYVDQGLLAPEKKLSIEDLQGSVLFPLLGDHSKAGSDLVSIGGNTFKTPVPLDGGFNFMRLNPEEKAIWASGEGVTNRIHKKVSRVADETGLPVNMIYSAMGKDSIDFATFPALTLTEMLPFTKILKKDMNAFHKKMKSDITIDGDVYKAAKDFPKLDDEGLRAYLEKASPETRKKFVRLMDTAPYQNAGFPSVAQARYAATEDVLKDVGAGESGFAVGQLDTSKLPTSNPLNPHSTYGSQLYGNYLGGLEQGVPRNVLFRDFYKPLENQKTKAGNFTNSAMKDQKFRFNLPTQIVDQELVDTIMKLR
jgi:hypothetical protein